MNSICLFEIATLCLIGISDSRYVGSQLDMLLCLTDVVPKLTLNLT